jgi:uncharacterized protein
MAETGYTEDSKGISWGAGFFMLVSFAVAGFLFASFIGIYIWTTMTGQPVNKMDELLLDKENANALRVMQLVTAIMIFLLPALVAAHMMSRKPLRLLGFKGGISIKQIGLVLGIMLVALFVSAFLSYINDLIPISAAMRTRFELLEKEYYQEMEVILGLNNFSEYLIALLLIAFIPAVCEEALFRGGLQQFLTKATGSFWLAVIVVSVIFSAAHFSYFGFLSRLFLGILLGLIYHYSGRLWLCIIGHFINNAIVVTVLYYYKRQGKSIEEVIQQSESTWLGVFAVPILIGLIYLFYEVSYRAPAPAGHKFSFEEQNEKRADGI